MLPKAHDYSEDQIRGVKGRLKFTGCSLNVAAFPMTSIVKKLETNLVV